MTTQEIPATGYSICYELGIFKQKIIDGKQVELADNWLGLGDAWLIPKMDEAEEVRFGGKVEDCWDSEGHNHPEHTGYTLSLIHISVLHPHARRGGQSRGRRVLCHRG